MPPTESLDPISQIYENQLKVAWTAFEAEDFDKANGIAQQMLLEPDLGDLHAAGFHLILAHSPDQYVEHAERAVELYKGLYDGRMEVDHARGPNLEQLESKLTMIKGAEDVLETARADRKKYPPAAYTQEMMREDIRAIEAMEDAEDDKREEEDRKAEERYALELEAAKQSLPEDPGQEMEVDEPMRQAGDTPADSQPQDLAQTSQQSLPDDVDDDDDEDVLPTPPPYIQ